MNPKLKKFAPFGLYLSLLAALVSAGYYLVQRSFNLPLQICLGLIVVGLALYVLFDPQRVRELMGARQARYGSNALILTIAVIGLIVVINVVVNGLTARWDLTEDKTNTLSKESISALQSLRASVKADAYFTTTSSSAQALLNSYKAASGGKFDYEFIDPNQNPVKATADKVTTDGTIVLKEGDRSEKVSIASEQEITNGLVRLDNPGTRAVYFLTGHGEYSPDDSTGERSYATAKQYLQNKNYKVATLNLLADRKIPADALALIIAGPDKALSADEVNLIKDYLKNGGSLVLLSEPLFTTHFGTDPDPLAAYLESDYGIKLGNDLIIDLDYQSSVSVAVVGSYGDHPITQKMKSQAVLMPTARSVQAVKSTSADVTSTILALTTQNSWGETSADELKSSKVAFTQGQDLAGPVPLGIAAENSSTKARVVVLGDADFAGDKSQAFNAYGNGDFLMNTIDWAAKQDSLISLTAKQNTQRILIVNSQVTMGLILLGTVFLIPGAVIVGGIVAFIRRRRRG
jgi:ABC-type uncharacterized transport system involved in gliding motility auxiliary subunit